MLKHWTSTEDTYLRQHYGDIDTKTIAEFLNRSVIGIRHRASRLGLEAGTLHIQRTAEKLREQGRNSRKCILAWKRDIRERDNFTCQCCKLYDPLIIQAHHIIPHYKGGDRFDLSNGHCLCPNCHAREHAHEGYTRCSRRITTKQSKEIIKLLKKGLSERDIAHKTGFNLKTIRRVLGKKTY